MITYQIPAGHRLFLLAIACALVLAAADSRARAEDARARAEGAAIAQELCSGCHIVDERQADAVPDAIPPFSLIAQKSGRTEGYLEAYLSQPTPPMPHVPLTARQIKSVISYIQSFAD